ncbi:MAG: histidine triad nucleotide-binding protein [Coriobacteriales bacterium]|jgi:histidine triad (HIT) family protein
MAKVDDCIFCKIANGEIPTDMVMENDEVAVFKDANPQMPVHVLIVPKDHYSGLNDDVPVDLLGRLLKMVPEVAEKTGIHDSGYRTIINTGDDANQTVKHLHIHVVGGEKIKGF